MTIALITKDDYSTGQFGTKVDTKGYKFDTVRNSREPSDTLMLSDKATRTPATRPHYVRNTLADEFHYPHISPFHARG
jgi:hypothetical protein